MQIGRYTLEGELGRGGMGLVYRARDPSGRPVALKLLAHQRGDRAERFAREARLQEQLGEAAGFVPLLDLGSSPSGPFLVMPLLSGGTLRDQTQRGALPPERVASLGLVLAEALGRAHEVGVVHRDVKPDNVLFTAEGKPLVADLGLAKHFRHDLSGASLSVALSRGGEMRGTLGYMAPEQLRDASAAGPRADVFALGAVLYECLAGHPPFEAASYMELLARVAGGQREPLPDSCPAWLRQVVDRALEPDPERRFPDGAAMAAALRRKQVAPRRGLALVLGLAALGVLVAGLALARGGAPPTPTPSPSAPTPPPPPRYPAAWEPFRATAELRLTGEWRLQAPALALAPSEAGAILVADARIVSEVDAAPDAATGPADQLALTLPAESPFAHAVLAPGFVLGYGSGLATAKLPEGAPLGAYLPSQPVTQATLDAEAGRVYAVIGGALVRTTIRGLDRPLTLADLGSAPASALASSGDKILVASGAQAFLLDELGKPQAALTPGSEVAALTFWSQPPRPLVLTRSGALYFFQPGGGPWGDPLVTTLAGAHSLRVAGQRAYLLNAEQLLVVDLAGRRVLERVDLSALGEELTSLGLSPGGTQLAIATAGRRLLRFRVTGVAPPAPPTPPRLSWGETRRRHAKTISGLGSLGPDFFSAGLDGRVHLWEGASGEPRQTLVAGGGIIRCAPAGPGRLLTVAGRALRLWDLERGRAALQLPLSFFPYDASVSPGGERLAVIGARELEVWKLPERERLFRKDLSRGSSPIRVLLPSPDQILLGLRSGKVRSCDGAGETVWEHEAGADALEELQLHAEGSALLTGCGDGTVTSRQLASGVERWRLQAEGAVTSLSTDERQLLVGLRHGQLELWDLASATRRWKRPARSGPQTLALLLPGGEVLEGGGTGVLSVYRLEEPAGQETERWGSPPGHLGRIRALSFSADSARVLGVGERAARSWTVAGEAKEFVSADRIVDAVAGRELAAVANFPPPPAEGRPKSFRLSLQLLGAGPGRIRRGAPISASAVDVTELAISADASTIALSGRRTPREIMILNPSGTPAVGLTTEVTTGLALSPEGRLIGVRTTKGFEIWGLKPVKRLLDIKETPGQFAFLPTTPPRLALSERLGPVSVVDPVGRQLLGTFQPSAEVLALAGTPSGQVVALLESGLVEVWEVGGKEPVARFALDDPHDQPSSLAVNPTGRLIAVGTGRGRIALFDLE